MDILYHSDEILGLRSRHWRLFFLMGIVFTLSSILVFILFGQSITLACNRLNTMNPSCTLSRILIGFTLKEQTIDELHFARIAENTDSDGDSTYRIILETGEGNVPLRSYSSSGRQKKADVVEEINAFLKDNRQPTLSLHYTGGPNMVLTLVFSLIGILEIIFGYMGRYNVWHIDKTEHLLTHSRKGLRGTMVTEYALDEVSGAIVESSRDSDGDRTYRITFTTKTDERIPVTSWYSSGYKKKQEAVDLIVAFLEGR